MCLSFNHQGGERSPVSLLQLSSAHSWSSCPLAHQRAARFTCKLHFLQPRLPPRMYRALLFAVLVLVLEPRFTQSSCQDEETHRAVSDEDPSFRLSSRNFPKRYNDIDYDSFVGLMGRRNADADDVPSPRKREMHDIFVGLMGRRSSDADTGRPWRRELPETRGLFFNKCRLRFRRGL
ncbi:tachykinin-3a [Astyanax mexicanus]|uniref:tachykinin-3a n=1 Tax=Astyanax mexicanus TaxID=7994 RepID=UPI0020CADE28|nr:tachykinin-3a [Astyanax mexicanus]